MTPPHRQLPTPPPPSNNNNNNNHNKSKKSKAATSYPLTIPNVPPPQIANGPPTPMVKRSVRTLPRQSFHLQVRNKIATSYRRMHGVVYPRRNVNWCWMRILIRCVRRRTTMELELELEVPRGMVMEHSPTRQLLHLLQPQLQPQLQLHRQWTASHPSHRNRNAEMRQTVDGMGNAPEYPLGCRRICRAMIRPIRQPQTDRRTGHRINLRINRRRCP